MAISIMQGNDQAAQIPRVWVFPKSRMKMEIKALKDCELRRDGNGIYTRLWRDGREVGRYSRKSIEYYPRFEIVYQDEEVKQAVAPYVVFK